MPDSRSIERLRRQHYNAVVTYLRQVTDDLAIFRIRHDEGPLVFKPGQYTVLGLGYWEPRVENTQAESADVDFTKLIRRAYSISSQMMDEEGQLVQSFGGPAVEFYITLVRQAERGAPALTPRLFMLRPGDRLHLGRKCHGTYTLDAIKPQDDVVFLATGTGEAPHNAMLTQLLGSGHRGRLVSVVCVRYSQDLGYLTTHQKLARRFGNYNYLTLTTRERWNIDPSDRRYVGKRYIQDYFQSGELERDAGFRFCPESTRIFLCGSPDMVGAPLHPAEEPATYPRPNGMVEQLERRGFRVDRPHEPGNVHFESYW